MLVPIAVDDCMTRTVETVESTATAREAAAALARTDAELLVVRGSEGPVGVVTESDVVELLASDADVDERTVGEIMSDRIVTVDPAATLERAAELFDAHDVHRLPVVDGGEVVGVVTTADLADYLPRLSERRRRADADREASADLSPGSPEMAYDHPDWEFEGQGTETGVDVGDAVRFRKRLTDADVRTFAEISGDTNRLHLEDDFAAQTRFGGRIAHGVLATGLISAALARLPGLTVYLSQDLRFLGPVGVDEVATAVCRVVEDLGDGKYRLDVAVYGEDGEAAVEGESVVLIDDLPEGARAAEPLTGD